MTIACYVYYHVTESRTADASVAARQIVSLMHERAGVTARLMNKVGEPLLWMEVYEGVEEARTFLSVLHSCESEVGIAKFLQDTTARHVEMFQCA